MKFNPIGSTFKEGNVTLKVKVSKDDGRTCQGCWYNSWTCNGKKKIRNYKGSCFTHGHVCTPVYRKDRKQVVFTQVQ